MPNLFHSFSVIMILLLIVAGSSSNVVAQEKLPYQTNHAFDLSLSGASGKFSGAVSWAHTGRLIKKIPNFKIGYGIRYTGFVAANKFYVTAPAKYTSPIQSLGTIFSETIEANIDTVTTPTANTNSINAVIHLEYAIRKKLDLCFNIDVIGFSFGTQKEFNVISSSFDPGQSPVQSGSPTRLNLLLTSDNDIGSLNSEFFVRYWLKRNVGLRVGMTFLFSEYRLENDLSFDNGRIINDRYRYKAAMIMMGFTFKPFN
jgi:hypothetical protein